MQELGGQAKAMVITASRQAAVKYRQAFEEYITKRGYEGIHALVGFSGKVKLSDEEAEYTEASINGFPEDRLTKEFDTDAEKVTSKQKQRLTFFLQKSKKLLEHYEYEEQRQAVAAMRSFVRYYEFLLQVSCFEDTELHKKYNFIACGLCRYR